MEFHERLQELRKKANLSQMEVAKQIGVAKSTYSLYENGKRLPDVFKIKKIISVLGTTGDELLQINLPKKINVVSEKAKEFSEKYDRLDYHGKKIVDSVIEEELKRMEEEKESDVIELKTYTIPEYDVPVSAGTGQYLDYSSCEITELSEQPPKGADFIVHVSGDSMEPTYQDGDRLFVSKNKSLSYGDIGIFYIEGNVYVKEYGKDGLISHNKNYSIIPGREEIECIGKVIGKVE